jgi:glycogen(starch) synthase
MLDMRPASWRNDTGMAPPPPGTESKLRVLRLCSVFELPPDVPAARVARFDPIGGMQNHTGELSRRLDRRGVVQRIITTRPPGAGARARIGAACEVYRVGFPIPWFRQLYGGPALLLASRLARDASLVHAHLGEDLAILPLALWAAGRRAIPLVLTVHCSPRHTIEALDLRTTVLHTLGGALEHHAERRAGAVIAITPRLEARLREDGVARRNLYMIPPGVDRELFQGPFRDPLPELGHPRVLFIGRLTEQKGVHTLLTAMTRVTTRGAHVVIVGDGPLRATLERRIGELGVAASTHLLGFRPHHEVPALLAHADVLVLPSLYEELGSILLEAMQVGLPVVASRTGGIPDVVADGETGLLVAPDDPPGFADAIDRILSDPGLARRLGDAARRRGHAYDWDLVALEVLAVYEDAIARGQV